MKNDKTEFIRPQMLATIVSSEVNIQPCIEKTWLILPSTLKLYSSFLGYTC